MKFVGTKSLLARIQGFDIRNGKTKNGGGVPVEGSAFIFCNNIILNVAENDGAGVWSGGQGQVTLLDNNILFNTAENNYWGSALGPNHITNPNAVDVAPQDGIPDNGAALGVPVTDNIDFQPFLNAPNP